MLSTKMILVLLFFCQGYCDWVSEWMDPVRGELTYDQPVENGGNEDYREDQSKQLPLRYGTETLFADSNDGTYKVSEDQFSYKNMKSKLETTIQDARYLVSLLKTQIDAVTARETLLKDAIVNGRSGVTALTVSTIGHLPSAYIIRDGRWSLCNGVIHYPNEFSGSAAFGTHFTSPKCIGQEILTAPDPCAFNSIIKYETTPLRRSSQYYEDDFFCLKPSFNSTMEQYLSVPRTIINSTCTNGVVRSLKENIRQCGIRMLSEYFYYPEDGSTTNLPMEYCTGTSGACNLLVGWHITNSTLENFEFLKNEPQFKNFFIASANNINEHAYHVK